MWYHICVFNPGLTGMHHTIRRHDQMNKRLGFRRISLFFLSIAAGSLAAAPGADELILRDIWLRPLFGQTPPPASHLKILYEDVSEPVGRDRSWRGTPYQIADTTYTNGLSFNATKHLLVMLGHPAQSFTAQVGLENNDDTRRGAAQAHGSVTFHVLVADEEVFTSPVMRLKDKPITVDVPLHGARQFEFRVKDAGDGRAYDQALWADAAVILKNGDRLRLQDLPFASQVAALSPTNPPFSFTYDGKPSKQLFAHWHTSHDTRTIDAQRTEHTLTYTDPACPLQVRCVLIQYHDFPTVEWTLYFKNTSSSNSPIIEDIRALDITLDRGSGPDFILHHNVGSPADGSDYGPLRTPLPPNASKRLGAAGGRPTNSDWSYFNLQYADKGLIAAIGWPAQWSAEFKRDSGQLLTLRAGQELTRFRLLPGEEVRTPLIALQFYKGDRIRAQNAWRRWMIAHSMPCPAGKLPPPLLFAASSRQYDEMINADEAKQIMFIDRYLAEGIKLDYWWMDAGWYIHHGGGWPRVGTWQVDPARFPNGLRPISDHAHAKGINILVWFEPERVTPGTWLAANHPEWIFGGASGGLLNLGNDAARQWLTDHVDTLINEQGIDLYRQDFNMDPLNYWRTADAGSVAGVSPTQDAGKMHATPDRQGIAEIKHVTGYLAYWDELLRRHPDMLIDSCASGGRRNDLETMRRAVPLWRSDYAYEAIGHQCMMYGLSMWLPYHGTGTVFTRNAPYYGSGPTPVEPYAFWSNAGQTVGMGIDVRIKELDYPAIRRLLAQWRTVAPNYYGDFYPLTPWTRDPAAWMAWQFDRPEAGEGMVQAFRRHESFYESARLTLHGLDPNAEYTLTNIDTDHTITARGKDLLHKGLPIQIPERPGVITLTYRKRP